MATIKPPPKKSAPLNLGLGDDTRAPKLTQVADGSRKPLCFKVPADFHRALKIFAADADMQMVDVMMNAVNEYMAKGGKGA